MKIVIDTREKKPWHFDDFVSKKLDTGDYSIEGMEDVVCIERKKSLTEISQNIVKDNFWREMERMKLFKHKLIICEFPEREIIHYPKRVPYYLRHKIRITGRFILSKLREINEEYGIEVRYCNSPYLANLYAKDWLNDIYEQLAK